MFKMAEQQVTINLSDSENDDVAVKEILKKKKNCTSSGTEVIVGGSSSDGNDLDRQNPVNADKAAWIETVKDAVAITPYAGELSPKGYMHSALGFLPTYAKSLASQPDQDMATQIVNVMAPKLEELAALRRFNLQNFDSGPGLQIGRGTYGEVRKTTFMGIGPVAVKRIVDHGDPVRIFKEVHTLIHVQNKRVLELHGAFYEQGVTYFVMELYEGTLRQNVDVLSRRQKIRFALQLLEGVAYIHDLNIVHCNITPENCFITNKNNIVLGEFSQSQLIPKGSVFIKAMDDSLLGTPAYNDSFANRGFYAKSTDVFSLGATIFEISTSEPLMYYDTWCDAPIEEYIKVAKDGRLCEFPPPFKMNSSGLVKLWKLDGDRTPIKDHVRTCTMLQIVVWDMVKEESQRFTAQEVIETHRPYFDEQLAQVKLSRETFDDEGTGLVDVQPFVQNARLLQSSQISDKLNISMDMIYYDANFNADTLKSGFGKEPSTVFSAIPFDQFKNVMEQMCSKYVVRVKKVQDGLGVTEVTHKSSAKIGQSIEKRKSDKLNAMLKTPTITTVVNPSVPVNELKTFSKPITKDGTGPKVPSTDPIVQEKTPAYNESKLPVKSNPTQKMPKETNRTSFPTSPIPPAHGSASKSATEGFTLKRGRMIIDSDDDDADDQAIANVKERSLDKKNHSQDAMGAKDVLKEGSDREGQGQSIKRKKPDVVSDKEKDHGSQGGTTYLPKDQRPPPASPKNVPPHILKQIGGKRFRGYFDCPFCNAFYNVDYLLVNEHMSKCQKAKEEEKKAKLEGEKAKLEKENVSRQAKNKAEKKQKEKR